MAFDYSIPFDYIFDGLKLTLDEIARFKVANSDNLFAQKKLHSVLDLDHTLLHTKAFKIVFEGNDGFRYIKREPATTSTRLTAREDFSGKQKKNLNLVLGQECGTVIVDDTESQRHLSHIFQRRQQPTDGDNPPIATATAISISSTSNPFRMRFVVSCLSSSRFRCERPSRMNMDTKRLVIYHGASWVGNCYEGGLTKLVHVPRCLTYDALVKLVQDVAKLDAARYTIELRSVI
ncbi:hypothetical protein EZV62_007848 [Acer yangbiense]|uniref:protein-serine/threonine phosphatase n=1 Tax=Acer yangbiense TaxID=1000413 RepID=A0A5C7IAX2_9ROSI|nr:hypothetical protein EZV62_007848 [Acer yangbiense]